MTDDDRILREVANIVDVVTTSDLIYNDAKVVGRSIDFDEWVAVATWGAEADMLDDDEPEPWPIRVRVHCTDDTEAEAYLSIDEALALVRFLRSAIRKARTFPQPPPP